jgi:adenylosuccinate synthase
VLLEATQATLLDVDHSTYPFVTSSARISGACRSGITPTRVDKVIDRQGVHDARREGLAFPTELSTPTATAPAVRLGVRDTTGQPRRCSWYDVPIALPTRVNGVTDFVLTDWTS